jgi:hypothetical protein
VDKIKYIKEINIGQATPKKKGRLTNVGGKRKKPKTMVSKKQFCFSKSNEEKSNGVKWKDFELDTLFVIQREMDSKFSKSARKKVCDFFIILQN